MPQKSAVPPFGDCGHTVKGELRAADGWVCLCLSVFLAQHSPNFGSASSKCRVDKPSRLIGISATAFKIHRVRFAERNGSRSALTAAILKPLEGENCALRYA